MEFFSVSVTRPSFRPDLTVLSLRGSIDTLTAPQFEKNLLSVLENRSSRLILDLKDVDYISSAGWGLLVMRIKEMRAQKGDLVLSGMRDEVREVFDLLEFNLIMKSFPDVPTAVAMAFPAGPELAGLQPLPRGRSYVSWEP
jgi:anti-anti-sigma factor